jgi:Uma2 family endonuclease
LCYYPPEHKLSKVEQNQRAKVARYNGSGDIYGEATMTRLFTRTAKGRTVADLLKRLGNIPPERVWLHPAPGTATEQDVLDMNDHHDRLCELVDGVLVEKAAVGYFESRVAVVLGSYLELFSHRYDRGIVLGPDGTLRIMPDLVRIPDVSFISWDKFPNRELPAEPIPDLVPDLAVEVLSEGNTAEEMRRKLREYFKAGVRLVWLIDPATRTAEVYTSLRKKTTITENEALDGGTVLPGFRLSLRELFARARYGRKR